ncbi:hypothetical protein AAVH_01435 [Aphelenchoides avenae]|nr:hypothetical protein AAVH_01435 [Aphelenchus avenae]
MPPNDEMDMDIMGDNGYDFAEEITPLELLRRMRTVWQNEQCSPKLLAHQQEIVELVYEESTRVDQMIEVNGEQNLQQAVQLLEVNRACYMMNSYLRTRVKKIEADPVNILREHIERRAGGKTELLSEHEEKYAGALHNAQCKLLNDSFLNSLPDNQRAVPVVSEASNKKKLGRQRVFVEVLEDGVNEVSMPDMADPLAPPIVLDLEKDSRHFVPLKSVEEYIENGKIRLI